jgi:hypothetical protein
MNIKKLLKLADFLEKEVKPTWFNLNIWATEGFNEKQCGSTACALGWCAVVFKKEMQLIENCLGHCYIKHKKTSHANLGAGTQLFDINYGQSEYLFMPGCYPKGKRGRMDVVNRIRKFVAANGDLEKLNAFKRYWD